jgi:hypothetical protein
MRVLVTAVPNALFIVAAGTGRDERQSWQCHILRGGGGGERRRRGARRSSAKGEEGEAPTTGPGPDLSPSVAHHHNLSLSILRLLGVAPNLALESRGTTTFFALDRMPVQSLSLTCALMPFLTCSTRSSHALRATLSSILTSLRSRQLKQRTASCKHVLAGMMIDASRWGVRPTALRTLAPGFTLAAWVSCVPLRLEMCISHSCNAFPPEASRELLTRHFGDDPDHGPGRLGADNQSSIATDRKLRPNGDYTLRTLFFFIQLRGLRCAALMLITHPAARSPRPRSEYSKCSMYRATCVRCFRTDVRAERRAAARRKTAPNNDEYELLSARRTGRAFFERATRSSESR